MPIKNLHCWQMRGLHSRPLMCDFGRWPQPQADRSHTSKVKLHGYEPRCNPKQVDHYVEHGLLKAKLFFVKSPNPDKTLHLWMSKLTPPLTAYVEACISTNFGWHGDKITQIKQSTSKKQGKKRRKRYQFTQNFYSSKDITEYHQPC